MTQELAEPEGVNVDPREVKRVETTETVTPAAPVERVVEETETRTETTTPTTTPAHSPNPANG